MSLQELLDEVCPPGPDRPAPGAQPVHPQGQRGLRFYQVDHLAMARTGTKTFQVNASGQMLQGGGGTAGTSASATPPASRWADRRSLGGSGKRPQTAGLRAVLEQPAPGASRQEGSRSYAADGKTLLIQPIPAWSW